MFAQTKIVSGAALSLLVAAGILSAAQTSARASQAVPAWVTPKEDRVVMAVNDARARYPLTVDPSEWLGQRVTALDVDGHGHHFGSAIAISGAVAVVGMTGSSVYDVTGAAYVFSESHGSWIQTAKLIANDGLGGNYFGDSVALDGTTILVGAPGASVNGTHQGAVYVFGKSNGSWTQTGKLTANDGAALDDFGHAIVLRGTTALVGAWRADIDGGANQGAVYVFHESNGSWMQTQKLLVNDGEDGDAFGFSLAVNGATAVVGAPSLYASYPGRAGMAYEFTESGGNWTQTNALTASDGAADDSFGYSVALDGATALIGATGAFLDPMTDSLPEGAAYVFVESGGIWTQTQKLVASDGKQGDNFGISVGLDSTTAVIGANLAPFSLDSYLSGGGRAYVFSAQSGTWTQAAKFAPVPSYCIGGTFGLSTALSDSTALIGDPFSCSSPFVGAAYFLSRGDLDISVSTPPTVEQGEQYTSQAMATNNASAASAAVTAKLEVPAATSFVSATATQGSCGESYGTVTCDFGAINGNAGTATANVTLKATGGVGTTIHNIVKINNATPALTASAPTVITGNGGCPPDYTAYIGTLAAHARVRGPSYAAPAGEENVILLAPAGFRVYARIQNAQGRKDYLIPGNEEHRWGPAGTYRWGIKAGDAGGAYTLCLMHP